MDNPDGTRQAWPAQVWAGLVAVPAVAVLAGAPIAASVLAALVAGVFAGRTTMRIVPPAAPQAPPPPLPAADSMARLRHDLNGILAPALLTADRLQMHADPAVKRAGEILAETVERAAARIAMTKQ